MTTSLLGATNNSVYYWPLWLHKFFYSLFDLYKNWPFYRFFDIDGLDLCFSSHLLWRLELRKEMLCLKDHLFIVFEEDYVVVQLFDRSVLLFYCSPQLLELTLLLTEFPFGSLELLLQVIDFFIGEIAIHSHFLELNTAFFCLVSPVPYFGQ